MQQPETEKKIYKEIPSGESELNRQLSFTVNARTIAQSKT